MPAYSAKMARTLSTTLSVGNVVADATAPRRGAIFRVQFGSEATPADAAILWELTRCTTVGTASAVTPNPLDPASQAAVNKANQNHTVDPTLAAILLSLPVHQRSTYTFHAADPEQQLWFPATANNGIALRTPIVSSGTPAITATVHFKE